MRDERDQLVGQLSEVLQAVARSGDGTGLLEDRVRLLARRLAKALINDPPEPAAPGTVEAVAVLVGVHWLRYRGLPEGLDQDDLRACLAWSAKLLPLEPSLVPGPVRAYLADHDPPAIDVSDQADEAGDAVERGARLLEEYRRSGTLGLLDAAIGCRRTAAYATFPGDQQRAGRLSNLGNALRI